MESNFSSPFSFLNIWLWELKEKTGNIPTYSSLTSSFLGHSFLHICSQVLILFFGYLSLSFISCRKILISALYHNESSTSFHFFSHRQAWAIPSWMTTVTLLFSHLYSCSPPAHPSPSKSHLITAHHFWMNEQMNEWLSIGEEAPVPIIMFSYL